MSHTREIDKLVLEVADNVVAQTDAIMQGDAKTGNKHAKRYIKALQALRRLGDPGRDALVPLMQHPRKDVCATAAAFLLRHRHEDARRVLEDIARGRGLAAFEANETLKRWEEKTWQLDPIEESADDRER